MHTWDEAAAAWLVDKCYKASLYQDKAIIRWLAPHFGGASLDALDHARIMAVGRIKAAESSPATANRHLALIRSVLRRSVRVWCWLDRMPAVELFPEPRRRVRWLDPAQVRRLLVELPAHQRCMVVFALATGLRQANVVHLEWSQVDMHRRTAWVYADQAKGRRDFAVPLNEAALSVLRACEGAHPVRVFTYRGRPISWANTRAWRLALQRAGIQNFRWHDLRHTWASWHVQHGTPLFVVQDLGAWSSEQMVRRYAHLAVSHYAQYAAAVDDCLDGV